MGFTKWNFCAGIELDGGEICPNKEIFLLYWQGLIASGVKLYRIVRRIVTPDSLQPAIKRAGYAIGIVVLFGYVAMFIGGPQGYRSLKDKWEQIEALEAETADLKQSVETLRKYNQSVKKDPDAQQLEIRKNLEMMRPGEMEFRYPKEQDKSGITAEPQAAPAR
jgi:cell division protein FtsB